MEKPTVVYEGTNPLDYKHTEYVAIQTETTPMYVWRTYVFKSDLPGHRNAFDGRTNPDLPFDMKISSKFDAGQKFNFVPGKLADIR